MKQTSTSPQGYTPSPRTACRFCGADLFFRALDARGDLLSRHVGGGCTR